MFQLLFLRLNNNLLALKRKAPGSGKLWPRSCLEQGDGEEEKARPLGLSLHGRSAM